jgi:hypothetical protein
MPAKSDPRVVPVDNYYYRRSLSGRELLPAIGVGLAAGALAFYVTRILLQREPVTVEGLSRGRPGSMRRGSVLRPDAPAVEVRPVSDPALPGSRAS